MFLWLPFLGYLFQRYWKIVQQVNKALKTKLWSIARDEAKQYFKFYFLRIFWGMIARPNFVHRNFILWLNQSLFLLKQNLKTTQHWKKNQMFFNVIWIDGKEQRCEQKWFTRKLNINVVDVALDFKNECWAQF